MISNEAEFEVALIDRGVMRHEKLITNQEGQIFFREKKILWIYKGPFYCSKLVELNIY